MTDHVYAACQVIAFALLNAIIGAIPWVAVGLAVAYAAGIFLAEWTRRLYT